MPESSEACLHKQEAIEKFCEFHMSGSSRIQRGKIKQGSLFERIIKLQYSHGTWSNGPLGTHSPDTTNDGQCQLCIAGSVPESQLFNEQIVKVPIGTSGNPFIYRLQRDFTDVCLRMSDGTHGLGPDFADNSGTVFYAVAIGR